MSIQAVAWAIETRVGDRDAKILLIALCNHINHESGKWCCFASQDTLAHEAEMSRRTVQRKLAFLAELGLIWIEERRRANGTQASSMIWISERHPVTLGPQSDSNGGYRVTLQSPLNEPESNRNLESGVLKKAKKGETEYTEQFEELVWKPYPRKNGTSKKDAFRKFARLGPADQALIISSIPIYAQLKAGKDEEFIQHLETFINKRTFDTVSVSKPALDANPGAADGLTRRQWEQILKVWRMDSNWRLSWGPAPGRTGCRCPADLLFANELPAVRVNTMLTDGAPPCDNPVAGQSHSGSEPHQPRSIP